LLLVTAHVKVGPLAYEILAGDVCFVNLFRSILPVVPTECDVLIVCRHHNDKEWKFKEQHAKMWENIAGGGRKDTLARVVSTLRGRATPSLPPFRRLWVEAPIVRMGWHPDRFSVRLPLLYFLSVCLFTGVSPKTTCPNFTEF